MAFMEILGILFGIVSVLAVLVYYVMIYTNTNTDARPQLQGILGSVMVGSIVLTILAYLALIQQDIVLQQLIVAVLLFFPIVMACIALSIST